VPQKGHIKTDCWTRKKKQLDTSVIELAEENKEKSDVLSVTNKSVGNKDRWIIDFGHHISFNRKLLSSYTSVQGGEVFMENSTTSKVIGEGTTQFRSHNGCITTLQGVRHVPESRYNLISLGTLHGEGVSFSSEGDHMEAFKDAHVKFQAERIGDVYML